MHSLIFCAALAAFRVYFPEAQTTQLDFLANTSFENKIKSIGNFHPARSLERDYSM